MCPPQSSIVRTLINFYFMVYDHFYARKVFTIVIFLAVTLELGLPLMLWALSVETWQEIGIRLFGYKKKIKLASKLYDELD